MNRTDPVIPDHIALRRSLEILDGMIKKLEHGERIEIADATNLLKFLRGFVIEHPEQQSLLAASESALNTKQATEFVRNSRGLILLLGRLCDQDETVATLKVPEMSLNLSALEYKYTAKPQVTPAKAKHAFASARLV
jgi:hypothetical protein